MFKQGVNYFMQSRIKSIISSGTLVNSMYESNTVNCNINNGKIFEYSKDFSERHPKPNLGKKQPIPTFDVEDYSDEEILNMPPR